MQLKPHVKSQQAPHMILALRGEGEYVKMPNLGYNKQNSIITRI
jgi:hypothetical protein